MFPLHRQNCQQSALYIKKQTKQTPKECEIGSEFFNKKNNNNKKKGSSLPTKKKMGFHLSGESRIRWSVSDDLINHQSLSAFLKIVRVPFSF